MNKKPSAILILEGEMNLDAFLSELLQKEGYDVLKAPEEQVALQIVDKLPIAVVLIPDKTRDTDGLSLLRKLIARSPDTRNILVSAQPSAESARNALLDGAYDYITWPIENMAALMSVIHHATHEFDMMQRNRELLHQLQSKAVQEEAPLQSTVTEERRLREINVLRNISTDLSTIMDIPRILRAASNNLPRLFDYALMAVMTEADNKWQVFLFPRGQQDTAFVDASIKNLLTLHSMFTGKPCTQKDVQIFKSESVFSAVYNNSYSRDTGAKLRSNVTFPLVAGGETIGCISLCSPEAAVFSAVDVQLFSLIAYQIASAVYNAKLFHHTQQISITDHLTGLYNRRHFDEVLEHEYFRACRYSHFLSLVFLDIDHFKQINDTLGHSSGDLVLQQISNLLRKLIRDVDVAARYGGEEFVLLLPETGLEQASVMAERIRLTVQGHSFVTSRHKVNLTICAGVATLEKREQGDVQTKETLVRLADEALLIAKKQGRNRVCLYTPYNGVVELKNKGTSENRRFPRVPVKLPVRYVPIPEEEMVALSGVSRDLSTDGIAFEAKEKLPHGSFVLLDLSLSYEDKKEEVKTLGRVVWSKEGNGEGAKPLVGVRLIPLSSDASQKIEKLVDGRGKSNTTGHV